MIDLEEIEARLEAAVRGEPKAALAWLYSAPTDLLACVDEIKRLRAECERKDALVEEMAGALEGLEEIAEDQWDFDDLDAMASDPACDVEDRDLYLARHKARVVLAAYRAYKEQADG